MKNLMLKLLEAQKRIGAIKKTEENPYFKSAYFDINTLLSEVKPILSDIGLVVLQPLVNIGGAPALQTIVADPDSGESIESIVPLIENADPQKLGSTITYQRRYSLVSLLCLEAEDDDGNSVSGSNAKPVPKTAKKAVDTFDAKRDTIRSLMTDLLNRIPNAEDIKNLTQLDPIEKNFDTIIERLKIIKSEQITK